MSLIPDEARRLRAAAFGATESFPQGDRERVERAMAALRRLGWTSLRVPLGARSDWLDELVDRVAPELDLVPVLTVGTDPGWRDLARALAERHAARIRWVELRPGSTARSALGDLRPVVAQLRAAGLKLALAGLPLSDRARMAEMTEDGWLDGINALVVEAPAADPAVSIAVWDAAETFGREVWLDIGGACSAPSAVTTLAEAAACGSARVWWHGLLAETPADKGCLFRDDMAPELAARLLEKGGIPLLAETAARRRAPGNGQRPVLITGGAGFIGTNLAHRLASQGHPVLIYDSLARPGVEENLAWLTDTHGDAVAVELADITDRAALRAAVRSAGAVVHLAAQVAVTTSVVDPVTDFAVNAEGTLALLEELRALPDPVPLLYTSTNKVYGKLADVALREGVRNYAPVDARLDGAGIGEEQPLDFYSPYGCSKGAADQYVVDYARIYRLPAAVFRMSCIYGPHQFGTEDQGWVAHFLIRALEGQPITLYGTGKQVRDILYVDDLVDAFLLGLRNIGGLAGQAFNIGGGRANAVSLLDLLTLIGRLNGATPDVRFGPWRPGDQPWYVSNTAKFRAITGWQPKVSVEDGVGSLLRWLRVHRFGNRRPVGPPVSTVDPTAPVAP